MARPGGNPNLRGGGKKGRSGRKSKRDEMLRIRVIEKAWDKKDKRMNDNEAIQIVVKDMTQKSYVNLILPKPILGGLSNVSSNDSNPGDSEVKEED